MHRQRLRVAATEAQATAMMQRVEEEAKSEGRPVMGRTGVPDLPRRESALTCFKCDGVSRCEL
jgi:hypothetical protein